MIRSETAPFHAKYPVGGPAFAKCMMVILGQKIGVAIGTEGALNLA
jgi:hypothetical protein